MDTSRLINFGKYDFNINKSFYRNISLVTIFGATGIALIGFFGRWTDFKNTVSMMNIPVQDMSMQEILDAVRVATDPSSTPITSSFLFYFCQIMLSIFAGYTFHNLRNKQGRITELTMPATNLERWTWHVLTALFGGFAVCIVSVLLADAMNAILNLIVYHSCLESSLSANVARWFLVIIPEGTPFISTGSAGLIFEEPNFIWAVRALMTSSLICSFAFFVFVNSLKYKYNIVLAYIITQVFAIAAFITIAIAGSYMDTARMEDADVEPIIFCLAGVNTILAVAFLWLSYRTYCKAQITSRRNK